MHVISCYYSLNETKQPTRYNMKKLLIASLLFTAPAFAQTNLEICSKHHKLAEVIMTERQDGWPLPEMIDRRGVNEVAQNMIMDAYRVGRYNSEDFKRKKISAFANKQYLWCMDVMEKANG